MKRTLLALGVVVVVAVALLAAAPFLLDPNDFKGQVGQWVKERTGRELRIEGEVAVTVFPVIGVSLGHLSLGNAPGFGEAPMARVNQVVVAVKLLPLLQRSVEVDRLRIDGLVLNVERNAEGRGNWEDLAALTGKGEGGTVPPGTPGATPAAPGEEATSVRLSGLELSQATLNWRDAAQGVSHSLQNLSLTSGALAPGQPISLTLTGDLLQGSQAQPHPVHLELSAQAQWPREEGWTRLENLQLTLSQGGKEAPAPLFQLNTSFRGEVDAGRMAARLENLKMALEAARGPLGSRQLTGNLEVPLLQAALADGAIKSDQLLINGTVQGEGERWEGRLSGGASLELAQLKAELAGLKVMVAGSGGPLGKRQLTAHAEAGRVPLDLTGGTLRAEPLAVTVLVGGEGVAGGKAESRLEANLEASLGGERVSLQNLRLTGPGQLQLQGELHARGLTGRPDLEARLAKVAMNPREFMGLLGVQAPATRDPGVLTRLEGSNLSVRLTPETVQTTIAAGRLDDTTVAGDLNLRPGSQTGIQFRLTLGNLDLDRYLAPRATPVSGSGGGDGKAAASREEPLEVDFLRTLNLEGELKAKELRVGGTRFSDLVTNARIQQGVLTIDPLHAGFYQGSIRSTLRLDASTPTPALSATTLIKGVQMGPFLQESFDFHSLTGVGEMESRINSSGATKGAMVANLGGELRYSFTKGTIKGVNLLNKIRTAYLAAKGQLPKEGDGGGDATEFSELKGSATIDRGRITTNDIEAFSPVLNVRGEGVVDLVQEQVDFRLKANALTLLKDFGARGARDSSRLIIPVRIHGPFGKPKAEVDLEELIKGEAADKLKDKLMDKLGIQPGPEGQQEPGVKGLLKGILQRPQAAPAQPEPAPAPGQQAAPEPQAPPEQNRQLSLPGGLRLNIPSIK